MSLLGIDSNFCPGDLRREACSRLAEDMPDDRLEAITTVEPFARLPELGEAILEGKIRGRPVIDVNA